MRLFRKSIYLISKWMISPVIGRVIGIIPIFIPFALSLLYIIKLSERCFLISIALIFISPFALAVAFLIHELGHLIIFAILGFSGRITYRPYIDLRAVPVGDKLLDSTGHRLLARALGGWIANVVFFILLIVISSFFKNHIKVYLMWIAMWQGVSALTATAWAAHVQATDAGSLAKVISITECFQVEIREVANDFICLNIKADIKFNNHIIKPEKEQDDWWLWIQGIEDSEVADEGFLLMPTFPGETLIYTYEPLKNYIQLSVKGKRKRGEDIVVATRGGTILCISEERIHAFMNSHTMEV